MRPVAVGESLPAGTRLTLFSDDKHDRFFCHHILDGRNLGPSPRAQRQGFLHIKSKPSKTDAVSGGLITQVLML
jgi:hypothetical protein